MVRPALLVAAVALLVVTLSGLAGCKGGAVSSPDEYRKAMKNFEVSLTKLGALGKDASTAGDPQRLAEAFAQLVPAARATQGAAEAVKVDASLADVHGQLLAAAAELVAELEMIDETVKTTALPDSKGAMNAARAAFDEAVEGWQAAVDEL